MTKNRLIVVSADAMVGEDVEYLRTLPNFRKYLAGGCEIKRVRSIYPTSTYPCHTTMVTGVYPNKHGITNNLALRPELPVAPWQWFHDAVQVPDLFTGARKAGLSTAAVFWPVTGNHPDIDHLIAEYWTQGPEDTIEKAFRRAGSSLEMLHIIENNRSGYVERQHPMCDEFIINCACDTLRTHWPHIMMLHPANIDDYRHSTGLFTSHVQVGIEETDRWIGRLMQAAEDAGYGDDVNLVLTSDHGQLEIKRAVNLNVLLAEQGLLLPGPDGGAQNWDAYCLSNGLSALIYLKDPGNSALHQKVHRLLKELCQRGVYGIAQVMTQEESNRQEHLGGDFSFVLEGDGYTSFGGACSGELVQTLESDYRRGRASHGHLPHKGPQPIFVAKGPGFRPNTVLEECALVDEAPTLAKLLDIALPEAEGKVLHEILA